MLAVDTNIIAYLFLDGAPTAHARALLDKDVDWRSECFALAELANVLTTAMRVRGLELNLARFALADARRLIEPDLSTAGGCRRSQHGASAARQRLRRAVSSRCRTARDPARHGRSQASARSAPIDPVAGAGAGISASNPANVLSDAEKRDLIELNQADKPLPEKYRLVVFVAKREGELVWNGTMVDVCTAVLSIQSLEHADAPRTICSYGADS